MTKEQGLYITSYQASCWISCPSTWRWLTSIWQSLFKMVKGKIMPLNLLIITQQGVIYRPFSTLFFSKSRYINNKTRGLRRWPTRETIVLRCNKLNPGSTEIFAIKVRNVDLSGTSVKTSKECVHKNSERYFI